MPKDTATADIFTDGCPVMASNLTGECGGLSSDEGCCVGTVPVISVSAVEDGWEVWKTNPSSAVEVPAGSSVSSGTVSSMSDLSSEPEPPDTLSSKSESSSELKSRSSSSDDVGGSFRLSHSQNSVRALACSARAL